MMMVSYLIPAMSKMIKCSNSRIGRGCKLLTRVASSLTLKRMRTIISLEMMHRAALIFQVQLDLQRLSIVEGTLSRRIAIMLCLDPMPLTISLHISTRCRAKLVPDTIWQTTLTKTCKKTSSQTTQNLNIGTDSSLCHLISKAPQFQTLSRFKEVR